MKPKQSNTPCTIVILGATGDLAKRKLIPAIYRLLKDKKITKYHLVGVSLPEGDSQEMLAQAQPYISSNAHKEVSSEIWESLHNNSSYLSGDFYDPELYKKLKNKLAEIEQGPAHRLFYLATMPEHFAVISQNLSQTGIARHTREITNKTWNRVVYEKPFGVDGQSAKEINQAISQCFDESQIYRIDHYLGKELVGTIATIRFSNILFQPLWDKDSIESVQIILNESIGIEGRGFYYDNYGALKDVVQNHMLQILALIGMEPPEKLSGEAMRDAKAKLLKDLSIEDYILGQYDGYLDEKGVAENSHRETFAALKLKINNARWSGVPFYLKTGKFLSNKVTSVHVKFKKPEFSSEQNILTVQIEPNDGFSLVLNTKNPGSYQEVTPVTVSFSHSCLFGPNTPKSYEVLLSDAIRGDQSVFVRFDEIAHSWDVIDKISREKNKLYSYAPGSHGPQELKDFERKYHMTWED